MDEHQGGRRDCCSVLLLASEKKTMSRFVGSGTDETVTVGAADMRVVPPSTAAATAGGGREKGL